MRKETEMVVMIVLLGQWRISSILLYYYIKRTVFCNCFWSLLTLMKFFFTFGPMYWYRLLYPPITASHSHVQFHTHVYKQFPLIPFMSLSVICLFLSSFDIPSLSVFVSSLEYLYLPLFLSVVSHIQHCFCFETLLDFGTGHCYYPYNEIECLQGFFYFDLDQWFVYCDGVANKEEQRRVARNRWSF